MSTSNVCGTCHGSGHDTGGRPELRITRYFDVDENRMRVRHETLKQGSGCITCGGKVVS